MAGPKKSPRRSPFWQARKRRTLRELPSMWMEASTPDHRAGGWMKLLWATQWLPGFCAGAHVPKGHQAAVAARRQPIAIRAERHRARVPNMSAVESKDSLSGFEAPEHDGLAIFGRAGGRQQSSVRRKCTVRSGKLRFELSGFNVPDAHHTLGAAGRQQLSVRRKRQ